MLAHDALQHGILVLRLFPGLDIHMKTSWFLLHNLQQICNHNKLPQCYCRLWRYLQIFQHVASWTQAFNLVDLFEKGPTVVSFKLAPPPPPPPPPPPSPPEYSNFLKSHRIAVFNFVTKPSPNDPINSHFNGHGFAVFLWSLLQNEINKFTKICTKCVFVNSLVIYP